MSVGFPVPAVWLAGDPELEARLVALARDGALGATPLEICGGKSGGGRSRSHGRLSLPDGEILFLKCFPRAAARRPRRDALLARLGASTAEREWRALARAHASGVAVPEPRGLWTTRSGDLVLATSFLEGVPLGEALACDAKQRRALLVELASAVGRLHASGRVHRDLHAGNVRVTDRGPFLVDLAASRVSRSGRARRRDWGELEHSLERHLSLPDRLRLRAAACGVARPFDRAAADALRSLGRATARRRRDHQASRTRRAGIPGRRFRRARDRGWRGLCDRALPPAELDAALRAAEADTGSEHSELLKSDGRTRVCAVAVGNRRIIVKRVEGRGRLRPIADAIRGSAGRRGWVGGHGLAARGIGVATPLAYLERRILGIPVASVLLLEDLRPAESADRCDAPAEEIADAISRMLIELHRARVHHGDLKASHVFLVAGERGLEARLIDLEGVRFRTRLSEGERVRALAELNASLPARFPDALRERVFRRYAAALPFREDARVVLPRVVARSLARGHRWRAGDHAGVMVAQRK